MVQPSGYKITDFAKNVDLLNPLYYIRLESISIQPITNFGTESKYYNYNDKKIYTAYLVGEELQWRNPQTPIANTLYNYNGVSYMWNGYDLQVIAINPFVFNKADVFSNTIKTIADLDTTTKTGFYNIYLNEVYAPLGFGESTEAPVSLIVSELLDSDFSYQIALYCDKVFKLKFRSISSGSVGAAPDYGWVEVMTNKNAPYKVYSAKFTQSGTSAPTVTVLENTIGDIVWTRTAVGKYIGTLANAFGATTVSPQSDTKCTNAGDKYPYCIYITPDNPSALRLETYYQLDTEFDTQTDADTCLYEKFIEIRVY